MTISATGAITNGQARGKCLRELGRLKDHNDDTEVGECRII